MIKVRLCHVLESNNLYSEHQSGCRENHSCDDNLVKLESDIRIAHLRKKYTTAVFLDLSAAFDKMWTEGAISILLKYGVRGKMIKWLSAFLSKRSIKVKFDHQVSSARIVENGCPQGSVLSPIIFSVFMNTFNDTVQKHNKENKYKKTCQQIKVSQYVDDSAVWVCSKTPQEGIKKLQAVLRDIEQWAANYGFVINPNKTQAIVFRNILNKINDDSLTKLRLCGKELEFQNNVRFLGIIFDRYLSWDDHINFVIGRCEKDINLIRAIKGQEWGANKKCLFTVYNALIKSKIQYGLLVYGSANKSKIKKLQVLQNRAIKVILGVPAYTRTEGIQAETGEFSIQDQIDILSLKYWARSSKLGNKLSVNKEILNRLGTWSTYRKMPYTQRIIHLTEELNLKSEQLSPPAAPYFVDLDPLTIDISLSNKFNKAQDPRIINTITTTYLSYSTADIKIFTDGSKDPTKANAGAGIVIFDNGIAKSNAKIKLDSRSSIFTCELIAIREALTWLCKQKISNKKIELYTDSLSALQALKRAKNPQRQEMINQIYRLNTTLNRELNSNINLIWIPSHVGIEGNDIADRLAKIGAECGTLMRTGLSKSEAYSFIISHFKQKATTKFNEFKIANNYEYGERNNSIIIHHPCPKLDKIYTRLRLGASYLGAESKSRPRNCPHCNLPETFEHVIFQCGQHNMERETLANTLSYELGIPIISRRTLLFPSKDKAEQVKRALFKFLGDINYLDQI